MISTPDINDKYPDTEVITDFNHYGAVTSFFGQISTVECFEDNSLVKEKLSEKVMAESWWYPERSQTKLHYWAI